ncbi:hypothetical protein QTG54_011794 [Skeletonema marinoi]|uniref:Uncharacterized protein n=1 Tax=Skeletonema marinoi TaxID=267567 RepID=A0AAD8Y1K6_9STRA|nr:hypothetical protein QTG54_011794 [Skeletonema marinoi]
MEKTGKLSPSTLSPVLSSK